jgi:hypothetical protein
MNEATTPRRDPLVSDAERAEVIAFLWHRGFDRAALEAMGDADLIELRSNEEG